MASNFCFRHAAASRALICGLAIPLLLVSAAPSTSAEEPAVFFRGLNLNGPSVTIDGHVWEGQDSKNYVCRDKAFAAPAVPLIPATDADRTRMITSSRWGGNRVELTSIADGLYSVFLYVWEDNKAETYSIQVNDRQVVTGHHSGKAGSWARLGPWPVNVSGGRIVLTSKGGTANFSGIELWKGRHDGSDSTPITEEQLAFFENKIRPLLVSRCYECHSAEASELQGELLVDSRLTLLRGGVKGPAVVPGDVEHSLLVQAVRYQNDELLMPPDEKLSEAEIADLEHWVKIGAPDPRSTASKFVRKKIDVGVARQFWSLKPVADSPVPAVTDTSWPLNGIDNFILYRLELQNLKPLSDADRRTLIRRATYDLTGLPATTDEIGRFLGDQSGGAFAAVVDRLLASPRYGERWGRHWMDLVRYADTAGDNSDYPIPQAYLYRNYIIDSLNADKPYDQFLREQIAGDLLPADGDAERNQNIIATGYIAIARRFGSIIDDYPQHLTIEDTLDNMSRTVLGLTISCARCHDHKFDPISQDDYYGLYGIFDSTRYPFPGIELDKKPREFVALLKDGKPCEELAYAIADSEPHDANLQIRGEPKRPGEIVARRFPEVLGGHTLTGDEVRHSGRLSLADWLTSRDNPLTARVMVNRIWQYHFGRGLVATPSDFGIRGTPPTHPELLDWLASRFMEDGWSLKKMHRRMMLSRTYALNSAFESAADTSQPATVAAAADPDNELYWRFQRQRLDAESLRDTLLFLSGELDESMPRTPHPFPPVADWAFTQHHPFRDSYETNHRSVYLMTARLNARPFFTTFDGSDRNASTPVRDSSVTTVQSLYLLNDEFVHARSQKFAERLLVEFKDDDAALAAAVERVTGRMPSSAEQVAAMSWLEETRQSLIASGKPADQVRPESWAGLARVLLRLNEFLYYD